MNASPYGGRTRRLQPEHVIDGPIQVFPRHAGSNFLQQLSAIAVAISKLPSCPPLSLETHMDLI